MDSFAFNSILFFRATSSFLEVGFAIFTLERDQIVLLEVGPDFGWDVLYHATVGFPGVTVRSIALPLDLELENLPSIWLELVATKLVVDNVFNHVESALLISHLRT